MEAIQLDPKIKKHIKDLLENFLYAPMYQQFNKRLGVLILRNSNALKSTQQCFLYKGVFYSNGDILRPRIVNRLHSSLNGEMDQYLEELEKITKGEIPYVLGFITKVLNTSNNLKDYLRLLPQSVHTPIVSLTKTYSSNTESLTDDVVQDIQTRNAYSISLMKERMVHNLLI